jgi:mannitol/fructose-specific phosphotransferase system IIA component (Ntr-type)
MSLGDFFTLDAIRLELASTEPAAVLAELAGLLALHPAATETVLSILRRREDLGSTGVGRGIAIPHARTLEVRRLRLAYARSGPGIDWRSLDGKPVHHFFLIVAPPVEASDQYLPVLGKIAALAREPDVPDRLAALTRPEDLLVLFEEKRC